MTLYETDWYAWTQEQAALLREGAVEKLDLPNLAEEVQDLGITLAYVVSSDLAQVLLHLLKWWYQPSLRGLREAGQSWQETIGEHRDRLERLCARKPSLRGQLPAMLVEEYPRACRRATLQTGLVLSAFPAQCPWELAQVLDADFWPGAL